MHWYPNTPSPLIHSKSGRKSVHFFTEDIKYIKNHNLELQYDQQSIVICLFSAAICCFLWVPPTCQELLVFYAPTAFTAGAPVVLCHGALAGGSGRLLLQRGRVWPGNPWEYVEFAWDLGKATVFLVRMKDLLLNYLEYVGRLTGTAQISKTAAKLQRKHHGRLRI